MMSRQDGETFRHSWDSWFGNRFLGGSDDIEFQQQEKRDSYEITLRIPNLKENKLDVKIEKDGISVSGDFSQTAEKKGADGNIISKSEVHRSISKNYPIPPDANYEKASVENKEDKIIITLPKKAS
jgi:HSP20 family molecular chaperone IbpA